jgi:hypothetical protein
MKRSRYNITPHHEAPAEKLQAGCGVSAHRQDSEFKFAQEIVDRSDPMVDADKARRLLASLIARRIVSSVSPLSDNKEKTP